MGGGLSEIWAGFQSIWEQFRTYITFALIGAAGGLSYIIYRKNKLWSRAAMSNSAVSAFIGFSVGSGLDHYGLSMPVKVAIVGFTGFFGLPALLLVIVCIAERIGINLEQSMHKAFRLNDSLVKFDSEEIKKKETQDSLYTLLEDGIITSQQYGDLVLGKLDPVDLLRDGVLNPTQYESVMYIRKHKHSCS